MKRIILAAALCCTALTACTTLEQRLDQASTVLTTGDALIDAAELGGLINAETAARVRLHLDRARAAIALARAALLAGNRTEAQSQAEAAVKAAQDAERLLRDAAPPAAAAQPTALLDQVAEVRGEAERLAAAGAGSGQGSP